MVGSLMAGPLADMYSRKYSISGWCILFMMGVAVQTGANMHVACIYGEYACPSELLTFQLVVGSPVWASERSRW